MRTLFVLLVTAVLFGPLTGCDSADTSGADTHLGSAVDLGDGTVRTFARTGDDGEPEALGMVLSASALRGLPDHGNHGENAFTLHLPLDVAPYDHIGFEWAPHGHEPEGLFTLPHFDIHFYMESETERATWTPTDPQWEEKVSRAPEAKYVPAGYVATPGGVPAMGAHWIDTADATYAPGGTFSEVFLWGTYDGRIVFAEPMITKAFLEARTSVDEALAQPQAWARAGYYPTRYVVRYDEDREEYTIALEGLTYRAAS
jgi:hypothetical protein